MFAFTVPAGNCPPPPTPQRPDVRHSVRPHEHSTPAPPVDLSGKPALRSAVDLDIVSDEGCVTFTEELARECYLLATKILQESEDVLQLTTEQDHLSSCVGDLQAQIKSWQKKYGNICQQNLNGLMSTLGVQVGWLVRDLDQEEIQVDPVTSIKELLKAIYIEVEEALLRFSKRLKDEESY
eukprot:TRINITY_DN2298_c0_g2_i1.p2 TRINITY_DN2298_c0_g2~~TRINITY_DN2298_c0_g2_i1.p2  ORF type:complete len:181 (-),score=30.06 TRINITY_DN2298_c0_g2_i1:449-991(-)